MDSDLKGEMSINGSSHTHMVKPGEPFLLEFLFKDQADEIVKGNDSFKAMHGKIIHLMIIKKDLTKFVHAHPYYEPQTGHFALAMNLPHSDPDNFMVANALTEPGHYMVMVEVEVRGIGLRSFHFHLMAMGESEPNLPSLDDIDPSGSIVKFFDEEGRLGKNGDKFQARLSLRSTTGCDGNLLFADLDLKEKDQFGYLPVKNITQWLKAGGHGMMISMDKGQKKMRPMAHLHAEYPWDGTSRLTFPFFDRKHLTPGPQRVWFQVKINKQVITFPFVINYQPSPARANCQ
jgi:hypothetical protein